MTERILSQVRSFVSNDRRRFRSDEFNLDLSYITDNVIAMSFPARGLESAWRNSLDSVCKMLKNHHQDNFMVWNLQEREYDYEKFNNQILNYPFPDHHAPPLNLLLDIVNSMDSWLRASPQNVATVHCKGGKGRTGTIIACYLLYSGVFDNIDKAINHFATMRSTVRNGVRQPSQKRYIRYFHGLLANSASSSLIEKVVRLRTVHLEKIPRISNLFLEIFDYKAANMPKLLHSMSISVNDLDMIEVTLGVELSGDIMVRCLEGKKILFRIILHTGFLPDSYSPIFHKDDIDLVEADKRFGDDFSVQLQFVPVVSLEKKWENNSMWEVLKLKHRRLNQASGMDPSQIEKLKAMGKVLRAELASQDECGNSYTTSSTTHSIEPSVIQLRKKEWREKAIQLNEKQKKKPPPLRRGTVASISTSKRGILKHGYMELLEKFSTKKLRWFELYSYKLEQYKSKGGKRTRTLLLHPTCDMEEVSKPPFAFQLKTVNHVVTMIAENEAEKKEWMTLIVMASNISKESSSVRLSGNEKLDSMVIDNTGKTLDFTDDLVALRDSLKQALEKTSYLQRQAVEMEDFFTAANLKPKMDQIDQLLNDYTRIQLDELRMLTKEITQLEKEIEEWKRMKWESANAEDYEKAKEFKDQETACISSLQSKKELLSKLEYEVRHGKHNWRIDEEGKRSSREKILSDGDGGLKKTKQSFSDSNLNPPPMYLSLGSA